jgi:8-oxo-dGTP diphosphatase
MEGQEIAWVTIDQLMNYDFPEANRAILEKILG